MNLRKPVIRSQFLIDPSIQLSISSAYFVVVTTAALFLALMARGLFEHLRQVGHQINLYAGHPYFKQVEMASQVFYHRLFVGLILCLVAGVALSILISHRMVGPMVRLRKYFEDVKAGRAVPENPLRFRDGDFFNDLPALVNGAMGNFKPSASEETLTELDKTYKIYPHN